MKKLLTLLLGLLVCSGFSAEIKGKVLDAASRKGLAGVRVTNGLDVTLTDASGAYTLPRHRKTRFVSVVMPADRKADKHYLRLDKEGTDFLLQKRQIRKDFNFLHLGDTENDRHLHCFRDFINYARKIGSAFIMHTGDICRNSGIAFHEAHLNSKTAGIPVYYSVGNHDLCKGEYGEKVFEDAFGPVCYAFEEGSWIFVVTPMQGGDHAPGYSRNEVVKFVRNILKYIPEEKNLVIFNHHDWFFQKEGKFGFNRSFADLSKHNFKALFHGHTHRHYVRSWGKGRIYSTGMSYGGGGGNSVAAFRSCFADDSGKLRTELKPLYIPELFRVAVSPEPDADGKNLIAAACYSTTDDVKKVYCVLPGNKTVELKKVSPWQYTGKFVFPRKKLTFWAHAEFVSGKTVKKQQWFAPQAKSKSPFVLRRVMSVPGVIYFGTPVFEKGVLYAASADENEAENGGVYAFSVKDGKQLWSYRHGRSIRGNIALVDGFIYGCDNRGNRIKLDAATGKLVETVAPAAEAINHAGVQLLGDYIVSGNEMTLVVSDRSGKVLWKNAGEKRNGAGIPGPYLLDGKTLYTVGNWKVVQARDVNSGTVLWNSQIKKLIQPSLGFDKNRNIIVATGKGVSILDRKNGKILVQNKKAYCGTFSAPLYHDGKIFIGSQWDGFIALDAATLKLLWATKRNTGRAHIGTVAYRMPSFTVESTPLIWKDGLLVSSVNGSCYFLSQKDGKVLWHLFTGVPLISTPVLKDGHLIQADYSGRIFVWQLENKGK